MRLVRFSGFDISPSTCTHSLVSSAVRQCARGFANDPRLFLLFCVHLVVGRSLWNGMVDSQEEEGLRKSLGDCCKPRDDSDEPVAANLDEPSGGISAAFSNSSTTSFWNL